MIVYELTVEQLRRINTGFIGYHEYPKSYTCDSCYSSYAYYDTAEDIVCDIVVRLAKSHYFPNGNKRTATVMYSILCDDLELEALPDSEVDKAIEEITGDHAAGLEPEAFDRYCRLLFPYLSRN